MREIRSMTGYKLVGRIELLLKCYADFVTVMKVILENGLSMNYLEAFVVPFIGDLPAHPGTLSSSLPVFDEYPVENFHSLLSARTKSNANSSKVRLVAQEIDARKHELHEFQSNVVSINKSGFSEKK